MLTFCHRNALNVWKILSVLYVHGSLAISVVLGPKKSVASSLTVQQPFEPDMKNKSSLVYQRTAGEIIGLVSEFRYSAGVF